MGVGVGGSRKPRDQPWHDRRGGSRFQGWPSKLDRYPLVRSMMFVWREREENRVLYMWQVPRHLILTHTHSLSAICSHAKTFQHLFTKIPRSRIPLKNAKARNACPYLLVPNTNFLFRLRAPGVGWVIDLFVRILTKEYIFFDLNSSLYCILKAWVRGRNLNFSLDPILLWVGGVDHITISRMGQLFHRLHNTFLFLNCSAAADLS